MTVRNNMVRVDVICPYCQRSAIEQGRAVLPWMRAWWPVTGKDTDRRPTHVTCYKHQHTMRKELEA